MNNNSAHGFTEGSEPSGKSVQPTRKEQLKLIYKNGNAELWDHLGRQIVNSDAMEVPQFYALHGPNNDKEYLLQSEDDENGGEWFLWPGDYEFIYSEHGLGYNMIRLIPPIDSGKSVQPEGKEAVKPYRELILQLAHEYVNKQGTAYPITPNYIAMIKSQLREAFYQGFEVFEKDLAALTAERNELAQRIEVNHADIQRLNRRLIDSTAECDALRLERDNILKLTNDRNETIMALRLELEQARKALTKIVLAITVMPRPPHPLYEAMRDASAALKIKGDTA